VHANYSEMAVLIPAGARELELAFHPPGWSLGVAISLAALCVLFALSAVRIRRKRR
jgi:uncharacterized membrane protein YfhO